MGSMDYVVILFTLLSGITFLAISKNENIQQKTVDRYGKDFSDLIVKIMKVSGYMQLGFSALYAMIVFS
jgi:hypothetical protein